LIGSGIFVSLEGMLKVTYYFRGEDTGEIIDPTREERNFARP